MATSILRYGESVLKLIGHRAKTRSEFPLFHINISTRVKATELGIRKHPRPYQRSREGKNLFQKIQILMTTASRHTKANHKCFPNLDNIIIETNQPLNRSVFYNAGLINCRSVVKMTAGLKVELADCNLHVCALNETCIKEGDDTAPNQLCLEGYSIALVPRVDRAGRGIALIYKSDIKLKAKIVYSYASMELQTLFFAYQPP